MEGAGRSMASNVPAIFSEESIVQYEAVVVCSVVRDRSHLRASDGSSGGAVLFLLESFEATGLKVQVLEGRDHKVFIKVAATDKVIGRAAETLKLKKLTNLGLQTVFDWELRDSFMRQPHDQALFSWTERYYLLHYIIHSLKFEAAVEVQFEFTNASDRIACVALAPGVPMMSSLEEAGLIVDIFPSHDEHMRKFLLHEWSLNWSGGTSQPLDAIYSYFGPKIALYFAFLEMYTNWLIFPAITGTLYFLVDLGKWSPVIPPLSAVTMVSWAALFLQFWKRRNLSILERWELRLEEDEMNVRMPWDNGEEEPLIEQHAQAPEGLVSGRGIGIDSSARRALNKEEWTDRLMIVRNIAVVFVAVMVFQIPFELLYAAFSQKSTSTIAKLFSISCYLYCIQKFKVIGGKLAVRLNNAQAHVSSEAAADSLIYKVFWIYFVQSYIGVFYHAFVLQDFKLLRQTLIDRMLMAQVINNVMESLVPYISYLYASRTYNSERKGEEAMQGKVSDYSNSRVEKEFFKPRYITNIAGNQHEGLFDDYLELALQFGIVVMFASFFPLVAVLALLNNLVEIRSDSFKLLEMMKRPVPHVVGSIGAWLHIFQYLSGAAIVSNCLLLLLMFDKEGEWRMDPGLAGVLVLEHALLAARFGLAWFVPEVPAWVKAKRRKQRRMQEGYSLHVLRSISKKMLSSRQSM